MNQPFAFDPLAGEEASTLGRLTILQARMNPDLAMGDELLKNLRRAGVQNTKRAERLEFTRLDPYPGTWVQGIGEYGENGRSATLTA